MKKTKFCIVLLVICGIITCRPVCFAASAATNIDQTTIEFIIEEELQPMVASACSPYALINGYYGSPGSSGGAMRVMSGGYGGACSFFTYLTGQFPTLGIPTPISGGGLATLTSSFSALSGYAVQISTAPGQPFKNQRIHFN